MAITFVGGDTAGANAASIDAPANTLDWPTVANGDFAIISWVMQNTNTPTTPSGFTQATNGAQDYNAGAGRHRIYYKVCDGTETGKITITGSASQKNVVALAVYRGVDTSAPIDQVGFRNETSASTTHASPSITLGVDTTGILVIVGERITGASSSYTPPSGYGIREDAGGIVSSGGGGTTTAIADDLTTSHLSGATVTPGSWTSGSSVSAAGVGTFTISLKPLVATPIVVDLDAANETDAAGTFTGTKTGALTTATETDAAGTLTATKQGALTAAAETDAAGTFTASKSGALSGATETDTAGTFTAIKSGAIGSANETDSAEEIVHETGTPTVEIITNGDFETDTTGWDSNSSGFTYDDAVESQTTAAAYTGSGSMDVVYSGATNPYVGVNWRAITLVPGTTYYVRAAINVLSGRRVFVRVRDWNGGAPNYYQTGYVEVGAGWQVVTLSFTAGDDADNSVNNLFSIVSESSTTITDGEWYVDSVYFGTGIVTLGTYETDTAEPITGVKTVPLVVATETDAAGTFTASKSGAIGSADESDASGTLTGTKTGSLSGTSETDAAGTFTASKSSAVGAAHESETAGTFTASKTGPITSASESDAAGTLSGAKTVPFTGASETDTAGSFTAAKSGAITAANETDTAEDISPSVAGEIGSTHEHDTAVSITGRKTVPLGTASESSAAGTLSASKTGHLTAAHETDAAPSFGGIIRVTLGTATEHDSSVTLNGVKTRTLSGATETDAAIALGVARRIHFVGATELDTAVVLINSSIRILPPLTLGAPYRVLFAVSASPSLVAGNPQNVLFVTPARGAWSATSPERTLHVGPAA